MHKYVGGLGNLEQHELANFVRAHPLAPGRMGGVFATLILCGLITLISVEGFLTRASKGGMDAVPVSAGLAAPMLATFVNRLRAEWSPAELHKQDSKLNVRSWFPRSSVPDDSTYKGLDIAWLLERPLELTVG